LMVEIFQAQRQLRQKRQPRWLSAASVKSPRQSAQAHLPASRRPNAAARSNMRSHCTTRELRLDWLASQTKIGEIGRIDPPAELVRPRRDLEPADSWFDLPDLDDLA